MAIYFKTIGTLKKVKKEKRSNGRGITSMLTLNNTFKGNSIKMFLMEYINNEQDIYLTLNNGNGNETEFTKINLKDRDKYIERVPEYFKYVYVNGSERVECICLTELIDLLDKKLENGELNNKKVRIDGTVEYNKYIKDGEERISKKYIPRRVYVLEDGEEEMGTINLKLHVGKEAVIEQEKGIVINGYVIMKNRDTKKEELFEERVEVYGDNKKTELIKKLLRLNEIEKEDGFNEIGMKVNIIQGSAKIELDESMLTDLEKDLIELGIMTLDELKKEKGSGRGEFKSELEFNGILRGYSNGATLTDITMSDFIEEVTEDEAFGLDVELNEYIADDDDLPF